MTMPQRSIRIFICYAHEAGKKLHKDRGVLLELLSFMEQEIKTAGAVFWWDGLLRTGNVWDSVIKQELSKAHIAVALVSQAFLNSGYITTVEIAKLIQRRKEEGLIIFPIILSECMWENRGWLAETQFIPREKTLDYYRGYARGAILKDITLQLIGHVKDKKKEEDEKELGGRNELLPSTPAKPSSSTPIHSQELEQSKDKHDFTDLAAPELRKFLDSSGLPLIGIDTCALLWTASDVANEADWGWKKEDIKLIPATTSQLVDEMLPADLREIGFNWRKEQLKKDPGWRDSIRYCVNKIEVEPHDRMRIFVQPIKTGTWYPISFKLHDTRNQSELSPV